MTPVEAFEDLVKNTEYLQTLDNASRNTIRSYITMRKNGKLKLKNIDTLLERHGYKLISQPQWSKQITK
jgi:hypothetical protein